MRQHSGKKRLGAVLLSLALCLSLLPTAALAVDSVTYIDAEGNSQTTQSGTEVTEITSSTTNLSTGWYVVTGEVTISTRINVTGEVHLILADGATLEASAGITVAQGNSLTVYGQSEGTGTLTATGGKQQAGIGGDVGGNGDYAPSGAITINGGMITAQGGAQAAGIGRSFLSNDNATFSTGENGSAVIIASGISDWSNRGSWRGVIFENNSGQVYGDSVAPTEDFTIPSDKTLTIETGKTLTIQEGVTLTNEGTITGQGSLKGDGTVINRGEMSVTNNDFMATVEVSISSSPATYNSNVTLTATVKNGDSSVSGGSVTFYRGDKATGTALNSGGASVSNGTATYTINKLDWTPSESLYTITAVYTPAEGSKLLESTGSTTLTVNKAEQTAPSAPSGASAVTADSITLNTVSGSGQSGVEYGYTTEGGSASEITDWQNITTFDNLSANTAYTFYARYAGNNYYEPSDPSITGTTIYTAYAAPEDDEGYTIDYAAETVTAQEDYEVKLPDGDTWTTSGTALSITPGGTFQVRHAGTQGGAPASAAVDISVPDRPAAPAVTGGVERIQGATTAMEYQTGDGAWTQFTQATVGHLDPGTYTVRLAATDRAFASDPVTVEVTQYTPPANPNYRIDVTTTEGGTVAKDPAAAKAGETVTLTPAPEEGYEVGDVTVTDRFGDTVAVTENADGTYTFTMPSGQVSVNVTFVESTPELLPFTDVNEGDWFHDAVRYVYENGLMDGVGDGQFAPNATTTRAQLVTILYRLAGEPDVSGDVGFTDVESGLWYSNAVAWAAANGIVNGISDTEFSPAGDLTREQLATILYRYAQDQGYDVSAQADLSGFPDAGDIQDYATEALSWAVAEGLLQGFEDDTLQPQSTATRAQIATILMRFCEGVGA